VVKLPLHISRVDDQVFIQDTITIGDNVGDDNDGGDALFRVFK
jgi:hypothetical protein